MVDTPHRQQTEEERYQEMSAYVSNLTDKLGMPIDSGIFETVVVFNLLGLQTFQSCEGHMDHGCPYPWVMVIDNERSRIFNRMWMRVCELEKHAKVAQIKEAYDCYLSADIYLRVLMVKWEAEDAVFEHITQMLDGFYASQLEQTNPARLLVKRLHPGTYRIEPGFTWTAKELPECFKASYLERGQEEMQAFTNYLKRCWHDIRAKLTSAESILERADSYGDNP